MCIRDRVYCPPNITATTDYNISDCDAEVKHTFTIPELPPPFDTWYQNEYRPFWEFDQIQVPIISPLVYAGGDTLTLPDGTKVPLSEPTFDSNTFCAFDSGQNYCTSASGGTGYGSYDMNELPDFKIGGGAGDQNICISYNLERICPVSYTHLTLPTKA